MAPLPDAERPPGELDPDAGLLARVAARAVDPAGARAAQAVFYARHVRYLYGVLLRSKQGALAHAGLSAEDLVQETFHRAFERAHTFQPGEVAEPERELARTRAWLGRIAANLLADQLGREREVAASPLVERALDDAASAEDEPPPSRSPRVALVAEGLEQLSERERDVLRVSALHYRPGDHQRLPNAVSAELAAQWGTTSDNIRAIRMRAMKKLRAFLSSRGALSEEAT